nr:peroxidase 30-like [Malus domestica]
MILILASFPNIPNYRLDIVFVEQDLAAEKSVAALAASKSQVDTNSHSRRVDAGVQVQVGYMRPGENGGPTALPKKKRSKNGAVSIGEANGLVFLGGGRGGGGRDSVVPNKTLKGFDKIGQTKEALESVCTKCVSCADIHVVATGDGIVLADGPLYPLFTGRRDSTRSYHDEAMAEILKPDDEITLTIDLFSLSGFKDEKLSSLPGMYTQAPPFSYQVYVIITTLMKATMYVFLVSLSYNSC